MESQQRFLHWILHSPSLFELKPPFAQLQSLDASVPSTLPPYQGNKRLGFLYQHLCSTLFQNTKTIDLVEEELQLKDHQRTLGAIDFILRNTADSKLPALGSGDQVLLVARWFVVRPECERSPRQKVKPYAQPPIEDELKRGILSIASPIPQLQRTPSHARAALH